jgi:Tfp pilus assembly protein PilN
MNGVNLIPRRRREASRRRARLRAWAVGASAYAMLCAGVFAVSGAIDAVDDPTAATRLAQLPSEIDASQRALTRIAAQLTEAQGRLDAARAVAHQPDWSVLLGLLAQSVGEDIVLTTCRLETEPSAVSPAAARPGAGLHRPADAGRSGATALPHVAPGARFTLELSGLGRTQASVSHFVLRLERLGLFERVTILKTGREVLGEHESIGFRLEAAIGAAEGSAR